MAQRLLNVRRAGSGPPLLLIHGVAGSGAIWNPVREHLERHFDVWRIDNLGYGYSPKPRVDYTIDTHIQAIYETVQHLGLTTPAYVMGLSLGATLALAYTAKWPGEVRAMAGIGLPYYRTRAEAEAGLRTNLWTRLVLDAPWLARLAIDGLWGMGRRSRLMSTYLAPRMYSGEMARESMMATYDSFSSTVRECMVKGSPAPYFAQSPQVSKLFLHGSLDQWSPSARVAQLLSGRDECALTIVPGSAHNVVVLQPEILAPLASDWILAH